jgi:6,7-dimethyl-8-ribityllumazine synthase
LRQPDPAPGPLPRADGLRFAIVVSRFNVAITDKLRDGARAALMESGAAAGDVDVVSVPGAFEIPQAARAVAETGRFDAVVCLGCVIRGATAHFEYIASSVAHAIQQVSGEIGVPMAFGVLTTDTWEQAEERAVEGRENKGWEAAAAAIEMAVLFRRLREADRTAGGSLRPAAPTVSRAGDRRSDDPR